MRTNNFCYSTKDAYDDWADDKLWLPSLVETGYHFIDEDEQLGQEVDMGYDGIWGASIAQIANASGNGGNDEDNSWLRTGNGVEASGACSLRPWGVDYDCYSVDQFDLAVRPALHFDLNSAAQAAGLTSTAVNVTVGGILYSCDNGEATVTGFNNLPNGSNVEILETVTVNDGADDVDYTVVAIDDEAFKNCTALASISIPSTVTSIGDSAFAGCSNLETVAMASDNPPALGTSAFPTSNAGLRIVVPRGAKSVYTANEVWVAYSPIIEEPPETGIVADLSLTIGSVVLLGAVLVILKSKKKEQF